MKNKSLLLSILLLSTGVAYADNNNYLQFGVGPHYTVGSDKPGFSGRFALGHFFGDMSDDTDHFNLGIETGVTYASDTEKEEDTYTLYWGHPDTVSAKSTLKGVGADLLGVAKYHFADGLGVYGKLGAGYVYNTSTVDLSDPLLGDSAYTYSGGKVVPEGAIGITYTLPPATELGIEAGGYYANGDNTNVPVQSTVHALATLHYYF